MQYVIKLIHYIVEKIEYSYSFLVEVLWDELIRGERNPDQLMVLFALFFFVIFSIISFYMESFVEVATIIAICSFLYSQFENIDKYKPDKIKENMNEMSLLNIIQETFHSFSVILFLIVLSNFLPMAGHFIMFWIGPYLNIEVPTLHLDLSLRGIWNIFDFEFDWLDYFESLILILSFGISSVYLFRSKKNAPLQ